MDGLFEVRADPGWYEKSYVATSFPPISSQMVYSRRLDTAAPKVAELLNNIEFGTQLINDWSSAVAVDERDPAEYARQWVDDIQDLVKPWLGL